ncbi:hypothetical protein DFJ74DRAFT_476191 [Hyaloraphidium curvatum]|nr:hypothetical protein DFJ74DRAFT_476191 [Hyaloraphidium curvatum]
MQGDAGSTGSGRAEATPTSADQGTCGPPPYSLPPGVVCYKTMPVWTGESMPQGFKRSHSTAAGVWGRLVCQEGSLDFVFEGIDGGGDVSVPVRAGEAAVTPPS